MSGRKKGIGNPANSPVLKAFAAFVIIAVIGFAAMAFAFNNGGQEAFKDDPAPPSPSPEGEVLGVAESVTIYDHIFINDIDVGGLTKDEAEKRLHEQLSPSLENKKIIFISDSADFAVPFERLNVQYAIAQAVEKAYAYGRDADKAKNEKIIKDLEKKKHTIDMPIEYSQDLLISEIESIGKQLNIPAKEPIFARIDGEFSIEKEEYGKGIDAEDAAKQADALLCEGKEGEINLIFNEIAPKYTAAEFSKATDLLGTFTTSFSAGASGRNTNLANAAGKINDAVLMPGEVFSTNTAFGEMTFENGYRMGSTIVGGKLEDGIGGGVCQVSSTLYSALLHAELEIVERQNHSLKVGYMDWGYDATLAGDYIDLKFRNDTDYPITIEAYTTANQVVVNIYGYEIHAHGRNLVFENALVKTVPPGAEAITEDPSLPLGARVEDIKPRTGYVYQVYKLVYQDGVFLEKVQVNTSSYRATRGEFRIGTGPAAPTPTDGTAPTETPAPTDGTMPTETPAPTDGTMPTETPAPTDGTVPTEIPVPTDDTQPTDMPVQSINIPTAPDAEIPQPDVTDQPQDIDIIDDLPLMP